MKIALLHPDLGLGGAERLVVDLALALKSYGHVVHLYTSYHDTNRCFPETKDGTLPVTVAGDWLPRCLWGRFHALMAFLRMIYVAVYVVFKEKPDLVLCDQVSVCIPVIKMRNIKVIFYCHFPDQLLTKRESWLKRLYRAPLDWLEEKTTGMADSVVVNSKFTGEVFRRTFLSLRDMKLHVLYPTIKFDSTAAKEFQGDKIYFLSLNRYERKKNIQLALLSLYQLKKISSTNASKFHLLIAGGYDERLSENKDYYFELKDLSKSLDIEENISFFKSPSDQEKQNLFEMSTAVLYTPENEHFGIVPVEAMALSRPVIACNSGGPLETIVNGKTGYLCEPTATAFAEKMELVGCNKQLARQLGNQGAKHVNKKFSSNTFAKQLSEIVNNVYESA